jgi:hypothetical protein
MSASFDRGIGSRRRAHRMHAQAGKFGMDAGGAAALNDDVAQDRARIKMPVECTRPIVCNGPEEGTISPRRVSPLQGTPR